MYFGVMGVARINKNTAKKFAMNAGATMTTLLLTDERGAITIDWVTLTAGILLLGIMIVYSVMNDSAGYLMDEFEVLNARYEADAVTVSALGQEIDINR